MRKRTFLRTFLSLLLCICMVAPTLPVANVKAVAGDQLIYQQNGIEVYYGVDSSWSGAFNGHFIITNKSSNDFENWKLLFSFINEITNIWDGRILSCENQVYSVKNAEWNQDIKAGSAITIGFTANGDSEILPSVIGLLSDERTIEDGYLSNFIIYSDWGTGFSGAIELTNTGTEDIEDWTLEFDFDREIDEIWNGVIVSYENNHYVIKNAGYNQRLKPGETVSIGFNGTIGNIENKTINVLLRSYQDGNLNKNIPVEGMVTIDVSYLLPYEEGKYAIPDDVNSITGSVKEYEMLTQLSYETNNTFGTVLTSGDIVFREDWSIDGLPFVLGYNELTVTAYYLDGTMSTASVIIVNMNPDRMEGLSIDLSDPDGDGLSTYVEGIYGTDPTKPDTDDDGLSDYTEIVVLGTNPMLPDTDENGILDGDEDYDGDGIDNKTEQEMGTVLYSPDSDFDGIYDYDEINVYHTDPLNEDSDGDGASDGFEISIGYDPNHFDETITMVKAISSDGINYELTISTSGNNIESLEMLPTDGDFSKYCAIPGSFGSAIDFRLDGEFKAASLKIIFPEEYLGIEDFVPSLYYIDEENHEMVEIQGKWDGISNLFEIQIPHFSPYIFLNKTPFMKVWEEGIKAFAISEDGSTNMNIVFVTDLSGSMSGTKLSTLKSSINAFVDVLSSDDLMALVTFTSSARVVSGFTSNKSAMKSSVASLSANGLTSIYTGIDKAVELFQNNDVKGAKMIIVFTDGYDEPSTSYDNQYKSIVEKAKALNIKIETIGIGTTDSQLLTKVANETGGNFYYTENATKLQDEVKKIQEEVVDLESDNNNDKIIDYYEKLLCNNELTDWMHSPVIIGATYEELQEDKDGDYDNDGLLNGEEFVIKVNSLGTVYVDIISDMEEPDSDLDGYDDLFERNNGMNPLIKNISENDYMSLVTNNERYITYQISEDFLSGSWLTFQLYAGNLVTRYRVSYVEDFKYALIEAISIYQDSVMIASEERALLESLEANHKIDFQKIYEFLVLLKDELNILKTNQDEIEMFNDLKLQIASCNKKLTRYEKSLRKLLDAGNTKGYDILMEQYNDILNKKNLALSQLKQLNEGAFIKFSDGKSYIKMPAKIKNFLQEHGKKVDGFVLGIDLTKSFIEVLQAYSRIDSEINNYEYVIDYLNSIVKEGKSTEMREAARQLIAAYESNCFKFVEALSDFVVDFELLVLQKQIDDLIAEVPVLLAINLGLSIGNMIWNIEKIDKETLSIIAIGDSTQAYGKRIESRMVHDSLMYPSYMVDSQDLCMLELLGQMRIVGEDLSGKTNDDNCFILTWIVEKLYKITAEELEEDLRDTVETVETIGGKLGLGVTGKFINNYLYKNQG